ncbi:MAG: histidinol phosphate phosphatase domain-containing protein [Candidatus Omnitrophica bacterium]|nr:histidinol phosphate phosphatase domain-containing protein [Candidatus Omnitrophota bacterium]
MYNLHCHSLLSDGELLPSEIARRFEAKGYKVIAITDHVDMANIKRVVSEIVEFCRVWPKNRIKIFPGIELTHIPPEQFKPLVKYARANGIKVIVGHGETVVEPVVKGTNKKAIESGIDILAHPGLISADDVKLAKRRGVFLELTSRHGHCQTNEYLVRQAKKFGAKLIINTDSHSPQDIITPPELRQIGLDAGLNTKEIDEIYKEEAKFLKKL